MKKINYLRLILQKRLIVFVLSISTFCTFGQTYQNVNEVTRQKIDSTYLALIKKHKIVGASIAIIDNGKIVYSTGYGYANKETQKPATDSTVYRVGSVTKSFTALSVMQLYQDSVIDINAPISRYLTDFSMKNSTTGEKQEMIIKNMMSHTAGMPCDVFNGFLTDSIIDKKWTIEQLNKQYSIAPANFVMAYSNTGYTLLGELVERTSGLTYEEYLSKNVLKPLNMNSSGLFVYHKDNPEYAMGYLKGKPYKEPFLKDAPAGLLQSSALDMANYTLMYLNNGNFNNKEILNSQLVQNMQQNKLSNVVLKTQSQYGYGLFAGDFYVKDLESQDSVLVKYAGHGGDTYAYHASFGFLPEMGVGATILTNTDNGIKITNVTKLLEIYLKYEKNKTLTRANGSVEDCNLKPITQKDIVAGNYSSSYGTGEVKNVKKIKLSQVGITTVLKKDKQDEYYKGKIKILGLIPIKIKDREYYFQTIDGKQYLKARSTSVNATGFSGVKVSPQTISPSWEKALGKYKITGEVFACAEPYPHQVTEGTAKLYVKNDVLMINIVTNVQNMRFSFPLEIINDQHAKGYCYGRTTGYTVSIPDDNTLYFSGFTFEKCK